MLDSETKRRIDACRDILVGKVPDPKSQVEQITIALIYKFMDDMDAEAEELGGHRSFFAGDYARFGWARLMAPGLGGFEVLALYSEAIQKMNENPGVPPLFRDIFKNAYLPYRDPETLKSFLKEINYFTYDHSERLGDAFEYLLSVLGSQGDAGQFRTPRHIIDFMVEVMDPKKNETILDPACGTAGFLISAWKHILKANTSKVIKNDSALRPNDAGRAGNLLTPDERARLAANIHGYDISPDMVRLSLVNLYLHGFTDPRIEEYDTLTSDEKWNEVADVILANPPFMSPKGGIKPHKRFSVQSSRSEVLFVDYMAEHLTATGRAAIVVPEGIIFQSGTAYKALRQMLVKTSLVAVVSLPAGVFNPYSGVKTSILILDKRLHKQLDSVLFVKVQNDGFNLGSQRRAVVDSHLPEATRLLQSWMTTPQGFEGNGAMAQAVTRAKLGESGDFNLSGERYVAAVAVANAFPMAVLRDICEINPKSLDPAKEFGDQLFEYIDIAAIENETGNYLGGTLTVGTDAPSRARRKVQHLDVLLSTVRPNLRAFSLLRNPPASAVASTGFAVLRAKAEQILPGYLIWLLRSDICVEQMVGMSGKGAYPSINSSDVETIQLPLPPLEVQHQIVAEIEGYQKIIDGARQVLDNYKPNILIDGDWPQVELGQFASLINGRAYKQEELLAAGPTPVLRVGNFFSNRSWYYSDLELDDEKYCVEGDLLYAWSASFGPRIWEGPKAIFHYHIWKVVVTERIDKKFLFYLLEMDSENIKSEGRGIAMVHATKGSMEIRKFPLPDLPTQHAIVAEIETEQALVNANRELIRRMEAKVKATIDRVWGKEN